jgi:hypothetical protein
LDENSRFAPVQSGSACTFIEKRAVRALGFVFFSHGANPQRWYDVAMVKSFRIIFPVLGLMMVPVVLAMLRFSGAAADHPVQNTTHHLHGLWSKYSVEDTQIALGDSAEDMNAPVRFYYFHPDGIGLYRYGRVGLNNTHSYDYTTSDKGIHFRFRKTGEQSIAPYSLETVDGVDVLTFHQDPRETAATRYVKVRAPLAMNPAPPAPAKDSFGRMWTNLEQFKTGGMGFAIYQMHDPSAAGDGQGWFHKGDFDVWSTERLRYKRQESHLTFSFSLQGDPFRTSFSQKKTDVGNVLILDVDPRNYWHRQIYLDGGKSFMNPDDLNLVPFDWNLLLPET